MNEVGFCPVVSGVLSSLILSCGVLSIHREGLVILCMAATSKEPRLKEGQLGLFLVTWAIVSPPRVWC